MVACFLAGLSEANIAIAQSAIADVAPAAERGRLFGYVYLSSEPRLRGRAARRRQARRPGLASWFGYSTPFWAVAGAAGR